MEWCFNNDSGFWGLAQQSMLVLWGMFEPADHDTTSIKATLLQCFHSSHLSYPNLPSLPTFHLMFHPPFTSSPRHQPNTAACHSHTHSGLFVGGLYFIKFNAANVPSQESSELQFHFWQMNETDNPTNDKTIIFRLQNNSSLFLLNVRNLPWLNIQKLTLG